MSREIKEDAEKTHEGNRARREAKKAAVLGSERKRGVLPVGAAVVVLLFLAAAGYLLIEKRRPEGARMEARHEGGDPATSVSYPVGLFADGKARHFEYWGDGPVIRYFILKSSDGVIRAAFDACDVCWPEGKGYAQEGDAMVCRKCGRSFDSVLVNEVQGGCNPSPLTRAIVDGRVVILAKDIQDGGRYFKL